MTKKSAAMPVVHEDESETLIVHVTGEEMREGLMLIQDTRDAVVGFPKTTNASAPLVTGSDSEAVKTVIACVGVISRGVVEKENVAPPSLVENTDDNVVDDKTKSDAIPVVAPSTPETEIVQTIVKATRDGAMFVHTSFEAVVGLP